MREISYRIPEKLKRNFSDLKSGKGVANIQFGDQKRG
jgi:hypothetical protein